MAGMPTLTSIVSSELLSFAPEMTIVDAVAALIDHDTSGAPVIDASGNLIGILTVKDCFRAALHASYYQGWSGVVSDYMTTDVQTLDANLDLVSAAQRFLETDFRRFPVMKDGRLIGLVMRFDLLRALHAQWERTGNP
ncbi:MAG: CBS domain-containing protein [Rhodobacter sp.]|nr:CBS domain-containing protein [Rhodobacter sp.]